MPAPHRFPRMLAILLTLSFCALAQASVVLSGTRLIFDASEKEATMQLTNESDQPSLIQAWIDNDSEETDPEKLNVPFVMTPTMFRMEPKKRQALRILYSGEPLPQDRESLFWLNVLAVPPKLENNGDRNHLQFAFRTRIKVMYRPKDLPGSAQEAPARLRWSLGTDAGNQPVLQASNATAYVVNIAGIEVRSGGQAFDAGVGYVLPGQTATFPVKDASAASLAGARVVYSSINDWGASEAHEAVLSR